MANSKRDKARAKAKRCERGTQERKKLLETVSGPKPFNKENTEARKQTEKKFRAQTRQVLDTLEGNEDEAVFPQTPRTEGYETH